MPQLTDFWPFLTAFTALLAAGIGAPIPEELPTIGAGIWVARNPWSEPNSGISMEWLWLRWLILPVCFLGVLLSDIMLYGIGRWFGPRLLERKWVERLLPPDRWAKIEQNFAHYGLKMLLLIR